MRIPRAKLYTLTLPAERSEKLEIFLTRFFTPIQKIDRHP